MKTVITVTKGAALAMMLSATTISSAQALTVYTAGPGSLAKSLASGYEKKTARGNYYPGGAVADWRGFPA